MALTPDDVVTKEFSNVRFKEGFDPEEVDDYLDEIVKEWRTTIAERDELKARVAELEQQLEGAPAQAAPAPAPVPAQAAPAAEDASAGSASTNALGILERAQRLHDEHVAEGQGEAERLVGEAKTEADDIVRGAKKERNEVRSKLETERKTLEERITELRTFERDYRQELRGYFEGKLKDLDTTSTSSSETPVSAIGL
ncbi:MULTISPECIES: DivIVA domain-containing protein [unclassified Microbacterium]|uniref:DivIVA domain-containing protein n=1 Tax=unclassified Microbacterium TaxID=2609290 RepID=UPI00097F3760|nr:DivIVA domain-containing protein [Microbacterium sp. JB110]RCS62742.1 DivIVA domain-containing protein [Microbacterium sp. JB110]SJM63030.1 Possibly a cell division protein, antigen 84 in Mycobacteria [Frigoribacterium sp. JB110]